MSPRPRACVHPPLKVGVVDALRWASSAKCQWLQAGAGRFRVLAVWVSEHPVTAHAYFQWPSEWPSVSRAHRVVLAPVSCWVRLAP